MESKIPACRLVVEDRSREAGMGKAGENADTSAGARKAGSRDEESFIVLLFGVLRCSVCAVMNTQINRKGPGWV